MFTLELWNKWEKLRLHLKRAELELDGTNDASKRSIGRSKVQDDAGIQKYRRYEQRHRANPMA
jgi:hypothetical protein